jgi:uncharacterized membrane protein
MKHHAYVYLTTIVTFILLDALWLSLTYAPIYQKYLAHILNPKPQWWAAIVFYMLYAFGLYFVVIRPSVLLQYDLKTIFIYGFVFGLTAYGTYDLTNQVTIKDWPKFITAIDLIYGSIVSGLAVLAGAFVMKKTLG